VSSAKNALRTSLRSATQATDSTCRGCQANSGDQGRAPDRAGQPSQQAEQQEGVGNMEQEIGDVMAAGVEAIKLAIQHVREPGERMPVAGVTGGERPGDGVRMEPVLDGGVQGDVFGVIVIIELEAVSGPVKAEGDERQGEADENVATEIFGIGRAALHGRAEFQVSSFKFQA